MKEIRLPFSWKTLLFDFNSNKLEEYDVLLWQNNNSAPYRVTMSKVSNTAYNKNLLIEHMIYILLNLTY